MKRQRRIIAFIGITLFSIAVLSAVIFGVMVVWVYKDIDFSVDESLFESSRSFESTVFYADAGGEDYTPVAIETSGSIRKLHYDLAEISPFITEGVVAVEDRKFYKHKGVDLSRTLLAAINLITRRERTFGASTITQQVIKNVSGDNQISIKRKISEIIRALHIERVYDKEDILEVYLNIIPMGDNIYGVGAASRAYFGKDPDQLSSSEAATIIGITNAPTAYSPYLNPDACVRKRNIILRVMASEGIIEKEECESATLEALNVIPRGNREDRFDSWFTETVIAEICDDLAKKYDISAPTARIMLLNGGYKVYTTMSQRVQGIMEDYFENTKNLNVDGNGKINYAMVVCDPINGNLLGIIGNGGRKEGDRLLNHAITPHIPASTLKPIAIYAPMIDKGMINWATVLDDVPVSFATEKEGFREYPKNSPDVYDGLTTVKDAIRLSKNTVAVRLAQILTPKEIYNSLVEDFGFNTLVERDGGLTDIDIAPMALGQLCYGVPLLKLTEAYSVFPNDGVWNKSRSYLYLYDHNGKLVLENLPEEKKIFEQSTARIMNRLLANVIESGTASTITLNEIVDCAGKTGTSSGSFDKLFVGYTPSLVGGIWCGYDNGTPIYRMAKSHLEIWDEVMCRIYEESYERETFSSDGLIKLPYCKDSGREYSENCIYDPRGSRMEYGYFTENNRPYSPCDRHVVCMYDSITKGVASSGCQEEHLIPVSLIRCDERAFPKEIIVTDAEFVFRDVSRYEKIPIDYSLPYFQYIIPDGIFVGRSKGKKQFNSGCYLHGE